MTFVNHSSVAVFGAYKYPSCILYVSHTAQRERNVEQKRSVSAIAQAAESEGGRIRSPRSLAPGNSRTNGITANSNLQKNRQSSGGECKGGDEGE